MDSLEQQLQLLAQGATVPPGSGEAGGATNNLVAKAQELDVLAAFPPDHNQELEAQLERMSPQGVQRELEAYEAEANELEGVAGPGAGPAAAAPAEEGQQEGEMVVEGGAGEQEEEAAGEGEAQPAPQEAATDAAAVPADEVAEGPPKEERMEAESKREPARPTEPGVQAEAVPEQGLKTGFAAAGESEEAPPVVTPGAARGGPPGVREGPGEWVAQEEQEQVQRMAEVAAPDAQMAPKEEVAPAAAAAASPAQVAGGQKRKAEAEPKPAEQQLAREQEQVQEEAAAGTGEEGDKPRGRKRSKKEAEPRAQGHAVYLAAVQAIPIGQTATYADVATAAGKGPGSARMVGSAIHQLDLRHSKVPWWRVVSADGSLHPGSKHLATQQLQKLGQEGARPAAGQSVTEWCQQAHCPLVGCYEYGGRRMVYTVADDPRATQFNPKKVEKLVSEELARDRGFERI